MKKKNILFLVIVSLVVMFSLGACTSSNENDLNTSEGKQIEIDYFSFSASPDYENELNQMIEAFEEENTDIKVNIELAAYDDYFTKLQTRIAGGQAPDVFELNYENFVQYASKGTLADLSEFINEDKNFNPDQLNEEAFKAYQFDGKQFGMVESFSNVVTFYNKDMFDEAGIEYPTADWKWADELEAAKQLTNEGNSVWGTYAPLTMNEFFKVAAQNNGSIFDENGKPTINSAENLETLKYMVDNVRKHKVSPSPADMSGQASEDLFKNGQLAILHTGIWMFGQFEDVPFEWDIQLEAGNTQKAHHFFANGLAVSNDSEEKEAAYKFAAFMSASEKAAQIRVDSSWELPAITNEEILKPYLEEPSPANREVVFEALDTLVLPPAVNDWSRISDITDIEFQKVLNGDITPEEALENLESEYIKIVE